MGEIDEILENATEIDVGESWFRVLELPNDVFGISEPHNWQEVNSYLILGSERALLFDTGMGIKNIRKVVTQLTDLEIVVVNSNTHFTHVGDNHRFETIHIYNHQPAIDLLVKGQPNETLDHVMAADQFKLGYPEGFDPREYAIKPQAPHQIKVLHHGDVMDLGDRSLEVLHTPGHTDDSIMLLDRENRSLFTGDTFYPDWLFAFFDDEWGHSNPLVYEETMKQLAILEPELDYLYPAHSELLSEPSYLSKVAEAFNAVNAGMAEFTVTDMMGYRVRFHEFEGFSILTRHEE